VATADARTTDVARVDAGPPDRPRVDIGPVVASCDVTKPFGALTTIAGFADTKNDLALLPSADGLTA
jgi:hypothetical protein